MIVSNNSGGMGNRLLSYMSAKYIGQILGEKVGLTWESDCVGGSSKGSSFDGWVPECVRPDVVTVDWEKDVTISVSGLKTPEYARFCAGHKLLDEKEGYDIGVHMRSWQDDPHWSGLGLKEMVRRVRLVLDASVGKTVYLASDDRALLKTFEGHVAMRKVGHAEKFHCFRAGWEDICVLGACKELVLSVNSTFGETAALFGGVERVSYLDH